MKHKGKGSRVASVAGKAAATLADPLAAAAAAAAGETTTAAGIVRSNSSSGTEVQGLLSAAMAASAAANVDTPTTPGGNGGNGGGGGGNGGGIGGLLGGGDSYAPASEPGRFRIWIDSFKERKLAPGVWLVRYKEIQQRFPAASAASNGRTTRWSTAVLREIEEESGKIGRYMWEYVHETFTSGPAIPGEQF
jgi:hypothetical protein